MDHAQNGVLRTSSACERFVFTWRAEPSPSHGQPGLQPFAANSKGAHCRGTQQDAGPVDCSSVAEPHESLHERPNRTTWQESQLPLHKMLTDPSGRWSTKCPFVTGHVLRTCMMKSECEKERHLVRFSVVTRALAGPQTVEQGRSALRSFSQIFTSSDTCASSRAETTLTAAACQTREKPFDCLRVCGVCLALNLNKSHASTPLPPQIQQHFEQNSA